jgi:oxygen-independent coproporphyrinogen III oxidase
MKYSLYIHIPFCRHRCAYCDFNTYAGQEDSISAYVDAVKREIELVGSAAPAKIAIHTVFFGGGTPTLLSPPQFKSILDSIRSCFDLYPDAEITTEANPGTVSYVALEALRSIGVNRISFGAQSANGEELKLLERTHSFLDVMDAVSSARRAGFDNLNLDLIYGLPEQELDNWKTTVGRVLDLQPEHISAYSLTLEHGTPFGRWSARGLLPTPDADAAAEMYEWASGAFEIAGYAQYEISNWAKTAGKSALAMVDEPAYACRHNVQYWKCGPYLGFGAGAHGYADGYRYSNVLRIKTYIDRLSVDMQGRFPLSPAAVNQHRQTLQDDISEFMIMGLRLTNQGISLDDFRERFRSDLMDVHGRDVEDLVAVGLLEWRGADQRNLKLTTRGRLLGNQVFVRFV